jgi:hypothetical protein
VLGREAVLPGDAPEKYIRNPLEQSGLAVVKPPKTAVDQPAHVDCQTSFVNDRPSAEFCIAQQPSNPRESPETPMA